MTFNIKFLRQHVQPSRLLTRLFQRSGYFKPLRYRDSSLLSVARNDTQVWASFRAVFKRGIPMTVNIEFFRQHAQPPRLLLNRLRSIRSAQLKKQNPRQKPPWASLNTGKSAIWPLW